MPSREVVFGGCIPPRLEVGSARMSSIRFTLLPDPELEAAGARLAERRLECVARALTVEPGALVAGSPASVVDAAVRAVQAHEGSIWLASPDGRHLTPVWNNGPDAVRFVGSFQLPASEGFTGMVYCTNMAACESEVCFQDRQHKALDERLQVLTWALLAVPLRFSGEVRGVVTAVRLVRRAELPADLSQVASRADLPPGFACPPSFAIEDLAAFERAAGVLGRLVDHRLTCWAAGWEE